MFNDEKFEDNVEVGYYDEKTVQMARDYQHSSPRKAQNMDEMYRNNENLD